MNLEKKPFNNEKVRQAINYAIDRDNLVSVCYDGEAEVTPISAQKKDLDILMISRSTLMILIKQKNFLQRRESKHHMIWARSL